MGLGAILEILWGASEGESRIQRKTNAPLKSDDEVDLGLSGDVEVTSLPRLSLESDLLLLGVEVLLDVLVGPLENDLSLGLLSLMTHVSLGTPKRGSEESKNLVQPRKMVNYEQHCRS